MFSFSALWRNLFRRGQFETNLSEELASYADLLTEEKIASGMKPAVARRRALVEIGGIEQVKENVRDARIGRILESLWGDIAHSFRSLRKSPGTSVLAIATLALGLGASTLIFSVFYYVLLQPLPFRDPERLVQLWETRTGADYDRASFNRVNFWDVRAQNQTFESMAAFIGGDLNLTGSGDPMHLSAAHVSADFFRTLGVTPLAGHDFDRSADQPSHDNAVVLLSERFWRAQFQSSTKIIGHALRLDGTPYHVIGIIPDGDPWLDAADVFVPLVYDPKSSRRGFEAAVIGRSKQNTSLAAARADLNRVALNLSQTWRDDTGMGILVSPSAAWGARPAVRRGLWILLGSVGLLLLIACVNVANLLLAKATVRSRELRVREALGASRARIVRLILTECLLLGGAATVLGVLIASWGLALIRVAVIANVPRLSEVHLNGWVLTVALVIAILAAVGASVTPANESSSANISAVLRESDRTQTAGFQQNRLRALFVTAEVALAMILLIGAGLLVRSFNKLLHVERGFSTDGRIVASINLPVDYSDERAMHVNSALLERVRTLPGVRAAGLVNSRPITGWDPGMAFGAPDSADGVSQKVPWASWRFVSTGYFHAMGVSLLKGRTFTGDDFRYASVRPVIISAAIADMLWPGQNPIGRQMYLWKGQSNKFGQVVGVVANTRDHGLDADPTRIVYLPFIGQTSSPVQLIVHSSYSPAVLSRDLRALLASIAPNVSVSQVQTMSALISESLGSKRLNTVLLSSFAFLALVLTLSGIYGVLSYAVARRTQEIGIRVALGANRQTILRLVLGQGMRPILFGILIGVAGALALTRLLSSLLFQVGSFDLIAYSVVTVLILLAAACACIIPAYRALSVDPVTALRNQ